MINQEKLRERVKIAKILNDDWTYAMFAEIIDIKLNSFYCWLEGYYNLSDTKANKLHELVVDLLDY